MYPLSILMRKCFNIVSLCVACPGDECRETGRSASPAEQHPGRRRGYHELGLSLLCFFPPPPDTLTFAPHVSEYVWRTHGWDSNNSFIRDDGGVTGKGLGKFAGIFKKRCISWNRMLLKSRIARGSTFWTIPKYVNVPFYSCQTEHRQELAQNELPVNRLQTAPCN